jgi:electron transfer DM13
MTNNRLLMPLAMLGLIGAGSLVLQRWVAETFLAAVVFSLLWALLVGAAFLAHSLRHRRLLLPTLCALGVGSLVAAGGFWYFSVRDVVVDEEIVVAEAEAEPMPGGAKPAPAQGQSGPVALARGSFRGEDGHDGSGRATVVETPDGRRLLTFSDFDVSPGPDVDVYLTPSAGDIDDRVELGDLKGNVGDQQYEIPASADLGHYNNVILYCVSFTVRIAVAPLRA